MLTALLCIMLLSGCASTPQQDAEAVNTSHRTMFDEARQAYRNHDYSKTIALLNVLASQDDINAQYALGYMYYYGFGVIRDENVALEWIKKAAARGHAGAITALDRVSIILKYEDNKTKEEAASDSAPAAGSDMDPTASGATDTGTAPDLHTQMMLQAEAVQPDQTVLPTTDELPPEPIAVAPVESEPETVASAEPAQDTAGNTDDKPTLSASASAPTSSTDTARQDWIHNQNPDDYTIQVISGRNEQRIISFMKKYGLTGQAAHFGVQGAGDSVIYIGVYGVYSSVADAKQILQSLPDKVKKVQPWIRSFKSIQESLH